MPNLDTYHPQPCANCDHRAMHGGIGGCIAVTSTNPDRWCDCDAYVHPRDRARDQAAGAQAGTDGADAALHGHALTHDPTEWRSKADARMAYLIAQGGTFTAEDITDAVGVAPSPNAIGGLFKANKARLEPAGFTTATRPEAHGRALRVWRGRPA